MYENSSPVPVSVEENSVEVVSSTSAEVLTETESSVVNEDDANPINRYCKCSSYECDCCREFSLPLVPIRGPGCANIRYLEGDRMSIGIKFGNRVLANRVISGESSAQTKSDLTQRETKTLFRSQRNSGLLAFARRFHQLLRQNLRNLEEERRF